MKTILITITILFSGMLMQAQGTPWDEMTPDQKHAVTSGQNETFGRVIAFLLVGGLASFFIFKGIRKSSSSVGEKVSTVAFAGLEYGTKVILIIILFIAGIGLLMMLGNLLPENLRFIIIIIFLAVIIWIFQGKESDS